MAVIARQWRLLQCARSRQQVLAGAVLRFSDFTSPVSLKNLYPNSNPNPKINIPTVGENEFSGYIPVKDLKITYSTSSGPGGQNVNRVATKVDLRFHLESADWLSEPVKAKLLERLGPELTKDGWLVVKSDRTRSQLLNQADALEKLRNAIRTALEPAKPQFTAEELEKIRKGKLKAARERLQFKRHRSQLRAERANCDL